MSVLAVLGIDVPNPAGWVTDALSDAAMAPVNALANAIADALQAMVKTLSTAWIQIDTPNLATADGQASDTVAFLQGQLAYIVGFCAVMALIVGGVRLAWEGRAEPAQDILRGLIMLAVVSGCGLATIGLLVTASDQLAEHIIDVSTDGNGFGKNLETMLALSGPALAPFLVILLGGLAVLVSLVQIVLILGRAAALVMLAGFLPLAASFTSTPVGRQHFRRFTGWTIALVAYKPVAALCYAAAFRLLGSREFSSDGVLAVLVGLALMTMAVVALPALMKFLVPAMQAISLGGGGGRGVMLAAMALPMGARVVSMNMAGGAGAAQGVSGPRGSSSPGSPGSLGPSGSPGGGGSPGQNGSPGGTGSPGSPGAGANSPSPNGPPGPHRTPAPGSSGPRGTLGASPAPQPPTPPPTNPTQKDGPDGSQ